MSKIEAFVGSIMVLFTTGSAGKYGGLSNAVLSKGAGPKNLR